MEDDLEFKHGGGKQRPKSLHVNSPPRKHKGSGENAGQKKHQNPAAISSNTSKARKGTGSLRKSPFLGTKQLQDEESTSNQPPIAKSSSPRLQNTSPRATAFTEEYTDGTSSVIMNIASPVQSSLVRPRATPIGAYVSSADEADILMTNPTPLPSQSRLISKTASTSSSPPSSESSLAAASADTSSRKYFLSGRQKKVVPSTALDHGHLEISATVADEFQDWDYSATERWGWFILIATWIVFVVGMGSCLGIWSWAWDVGNTPYAPPELEDDPTLPILGYYPALLVLTGIVSWIWVIVAWVGMKYFKHAKIQSEER